MIPSWNIKTLLQRVRALAVTLCVVLLFLQNAAAQDTVRVKEVTVSAKDTTKRHSRKLSAFKKLPRTTQSDKVVVTPDSNVNGLHVTADTVVVATAPGHSPTKALWMSAVLPGLGQVYNKQAWKIPIIYAGAAGVTYFAITNYRSREKFKNEYINRQNGNTEDLLERYANYPDANIYSLYQSYNRNFQLSIIVGGVFYVLNIIDAYVYGHLFDFEITDDISLHLRPNVDLFTFGNGFSSPSTGLTVQIKF